MKRSYFARICVPATLCLLLPAAAQAGSSFVDGAAAAAAPLVARAALDFRVTVHASLALRLDANTARVQGSGGPLNVQGAAEGAAWLGARRGPTDVRVPLAAAQDAPGRVTLAAP